MSRAPRTWCRCDCANRRPAARCLRSRARGFRGSAQRGVDLALHPGQRSQVRLGGVCHAVLPGDSQRGQTLKPETEPFSSTASSASWSIDTAVWRVPSEVCSVTARMSFIAAATRPAVAACSCIVGRDALDQAGGFGGDLVDLGERLAGGVGELRALDHVAGGASIAPTASWVSVWMVLTIAAICLVAFGRAFGEALHFLGDDGEAAPGLAGGGGLMAALSASTLVCSVMSEMSRRSRRSPARIRRGA